MSEVSVPKPRICERMSSVRTELRVCSEWLAVFALDPLHRHPAAERIRGKWRHLAAHLDERESPEIHRLSRAVTSPIRWTVLPRP